MPHYRFESRPCPEEPCDHVLRNEGKLGEARFANAGQAQAFREMIARGISPLLAAKETGATYRPENEPDVTPETHPNHHTVGRRFRGLNLQTEESDTFYCESHDRCGYNMASESGTYHTNVSERAIGRTFHEIHDW